MPPENLRTTLPDGRHVLRVGERVTFNQIWGAHFGQITTNNPPVNGTDCLTEIAHLVPGQTIYVRYGHSRCLPVWQGTYIENPDRGILLTKDISQRENKLDDFPLEEE